MACKNDTDGDGNCGRPHCPVCCDSTPNENGEIRMPTFGQSVWMMVNGEPALRYFVKWDGNGCVVAFEKSDCKLIYGGGPKAQGKGYWTGHQRFWATEADVLLCYVKGIENQLEHFAGELKRRREQLERAIRQNDKARGTAGGRKPTANTLTL